MNQVSCGWNVNSGMGACRLSSREHIGTWIDLLDRPLGVLQNNYICNLDQYVALQNNV